MAEVAKISLCASIYWLSPQTRVTSEKSFAKNLIKTTHRIIVCHEQLRTSLDSSSCKSLFRKQLFQFRKASFESLLFLVAEDQESKWQAPTWRLSHQFDELMIHSIETMAQIDLCHRQNKFDHFELSFCALFLKTHRQQQPRQNHSRVG